MNFVKTDLCTMFCLQAFESELQCRLGAGVGTSSRSRYLKKSDDVSYAADKTFDISLSMLPCTCHLFSRTVMKLFTVFRS